MTELNGATVLVTGAGGGFGQEMVRQFAAAGSRLLPILVGRPEQ